VRQISCSECGWTGRVLKEASTGAPITSFVCPKCLTDQNADRPDAKIIQFPAVSERLGSAPAHACDVTRRGDSSHREVDVWPARGSVVRWSPPDEFHLTQSYRARGGQ
jgi:hypothetical protein